LRINSNLDGVTGRVEVVLLSRNSADTGLRVCQFHPALMAWALPSRFCWWPQPFNIFRPFGKQLFSREQRDVAVALKPLCGATILLMTTSREMPR